MEFDKDGRIILPESVAKDNKKVQRSIILEKVQVRVSNPAIAQLKIKLGPKLNVNKEDLIKKIYSFCEKFIQGNSSKVNSDIKMFGETVIVEAKSSMMMYSFLQNLIVDIRGVYGVYAEYGEKYDIVLKGSWSNGF